MTDVYKETTTAARTGRWRSIYCVAVTKNKSTNLDLGCYEDKVEEYGCK